jgi:hypothetical protein
VTVRRPALEPRRPRPFAVWPALLVAVTVVAGCSSGSAGAPSTGAPSSGAQATAGSAAGQPSPTGPAADAGQSDAAPTGSGNGSPGFTGGSAAPSILLNPTLGRQGAFCRLLTPAQAARVLGARPTASRPHLAGDRPGGKVLDGCVFVAGSSMVTYDVIDLGATQSDPAGIARSVLPDTGAPGAAAFDPKVGSGSAGVQSNAPGGGTVILVAIGGHREVIITVSMKTAAAARKSATSAATLLLGH